MFRTAVLALWFACISSPGWAAELVLWCIPETEEEAGASEAVALRLIVENASNAHGITLDAGSLWSTHIHRKTITDTGEPTRSLSAHMSSYVRLVTLGPRQMFGRRMELSDENRVSIEGLLNGTIRVGVSARYREKDSEEVKRIRLEAIPLVPIKGVPGHTSRQEPGLGRGTTKDLHTIAGPSQGEDRPRTPAKPASTPTQVPPGQESRGDSAIGTTESRERVVGFSTASVLGLTFAGILLGFASAWLLLRCRAR